MAVGIRAEFDENIVSKISQSAVKSDYGARPLRREISTLIEDKISDMILRNEVKSGDCISVGFYENALQINTKNG